MESLDLTDASRGLISKIPHQTLRTIKTLKLEVSKEEDTAAAQELIKLSESGQLPSLTSLFFDNFAFSREIYALNLPKLRSFRCCRLSELFAAPELIELSVTAVAETDIEHMRTFTALTALTVGSRVCLDDVLGSALKEGCWPLLTSLDCSWPCNESGSIVRALAVTPHKHLQTLRCPPGSANEIHNILQAHKELTSVSITQSSYSDVTEWRTSLSSGKVCGLRSLFVRSAQGDRLVLGVRMPSLTELFLGENTEVSLASIIASFPSLRVLTVKGLVAPEVWTKRKRNTTVERLSLTTYRDQSFESATLTTFDSLKQIAEFILSLGGLRCLELHVRKTQLGLFENITSQTKATGRNCAVTALCFQYTTGNERWNRSEEAREDTERTFDACKQLLRAFPCLTMLKLNKSLRADAAQWIRQTNPRLHLDAAEWKE